MSDMECKLTQRGFEYYEFTDRYGEKCSLQKSSLATGDAIWMGVNDLGLKGMRYGQGWTPISEEEVADVFGYQMVQGNKRMHLTRDQVARLLPILQRFVDTGEVGERAGDKLVEELEREEIINLQHDHYVIGDMDRLIERILASRPEPAADAVERAGYEADQKLFERVGKHVKQAMEFAILGEMDLSDVDIYSEKYRDRIVDDISEDIVAPIEAEARLYAAVPTVQAAAGDDLDADWLDTALNSVHPECRVERTIRVEGQWDARIAWPLEPIQEPQQESIWDRQEGTGPTRREAIQDAVRQAKENGDE